MDGGATELEEIRVIFDGVVPLVFQRMHTAGELAHHWPLVAGVLREPAPLPFEVVQALFIVFSAQCTSNYCFVMHSLALGLLGADEAELAELARRFDMPAVVADHERWSRLLKLAWLAYRNGPQAAVTDALLRRECSEAEYAQIMTVHQANAQLNRFTLEPELDVEGEALILGYPPQLQALVPKFVQFHTHVSGAGSCERPVSTMCSYCRRIRDLDGQWFAYATASQLLPEDVLFSHGLCEVCLEAQAQLSSP